MRAASPRVQSACPMEAPAEAAAPREAGQAAEEEGEGLLAVAAALAHVADCLPA